MAGGRLAVIVERGVETAMRDGVVLRADIWRPAPGGRWPTLLQRLPYDKSASFGAAYINSLEPLRAVAAGFAVVVQDTRGRFTSDGTFDPFVCETDDGVDTIAWIRSQDFSDGTVSTYGASYIGATQFLVAAGAPEGLAAIAPNLTSANYYEPWSYVGGARQHAFLAQWVIESLAPPDVLRSRSAVRSRGAGLLGRMQRDPWAVFQRLPSDDDELAELAPYYRQWLRHPTPDEYWRAIDASSRFSTMDVAGLHIAGWHDIFLEGGLKAYAGLRSVAPSERARANQHLIVGPWSHGNIGDYQGDLWYGYGAAAAGMDLCAIQLEFFAAVHAARPAGLPRVRLFVMGRDSWRDEDEWPLARTRPLALYLRPDTGSGASLSEAPPHADSPAMSYVSDPADPVPTVGGANFLPGILLGKGSGPKDQATCESRRDVLVYTSDPLAEDLEVTGEVVLELHAASTGTDCDWTARLVDVHPDGRAYAVVDGILRARYRHGLDRPLAIEPGGVEAYRVVLGTTCQVFRAGHRIRLHVASSNFPRFDRNPQQFIPVERTAESDFFVAQQTVFHDASRPSRLVLPVVP